MRVRSITLEEVLAARERRAEIQNNMLAEWNGNAAVPGTGDAGRAFLVCLTLNIAGEVKRTPMTRLLFDRGVAAFESLADAERPGMEITESRIIDEATGSEAFWLVRGDARRVKSKLEAIEDSFPAARLFDFDVLVQTEPGQPAAKLSRAVSRRCLICDRPAAECARNRTHGLRAVKIETGRLLKEFCAGTLANAAYRSLLDELYTTPKPGLVDLMSNGAHKDMDVPLFEKSAESLRPYFYDAALLGMIGCSMGELRMLGLEAEAEMFAATGGVNTHKGMIYSMGLLLAGAGKALAYNNADGVSADDGSTEDISDNGESRGMESSREPEFADLVIQYAADFAREDAGAMLARSEADPSTNGARVLREYGAKGATWEAASGFPDAVYCADRLEYYKQGNGTGYYFDAGALAFCDSMARLEDTNLLHRGGPEGLAFARNAAAEINGFHPDERIAALRRLDAGMIARNLSPGGSADMLALAFFINRLRQCSSI